MFETPVKKTGLRYECYSYQRTFFCSSITLGTFRDCSYRCMVSDPSAEQVFSAPLPQEPRFNRCSTSRSSSWGSVPLTGKTISVHKPSSLSRARLFASYRASLESSSRLRVIIQAKGLVYSFEGELPVKPLRHVTTSYQNESYPM